MQSRPSTVSWHSQLPPALLLWQTIHWLRYGVLPVFVIEGRTPAAKLDKLRARWGGQEVQVSSFAAAVLLSSQQLWCVVWRALCSREVCNTAARTALNS